VDWCVVHERQFAGSVAFTALDTSAVPGLVQQAQMLDSATNGRRGAVRFDAPGTHEIGVDHPGDQCPFNYMGLKG
jgi:hypothetical protein